MDTYKKLTFILLVVIIAFSACHGNNKLDKQQSITISKGLYSFGPEIKSFTNCEDNKEYWVLDSAKTLELAYSNLGFEKPYTPVYVEFEGHLIKSDTAVVDGDYDSTMVVTKLLRISKQISEGPCSQ